MSSISRAGIFIDIKALLEYTDRMVGEMTIADRKRYGDDLVRLNLAMIGDFTIAFHRKEDKHEYIDHLEADFESYKTLMEFCWASNKFSRISTASSFLGTTLDQIEYTSRGKHIKELWR